MKRLLLAASALVLVAVLGAGARGLHLVRKLDTPGFQRSLLDRARATVGTDVRVRRLSVSLRLFKKKIL